MKWILLVYRVPTEPASHRVAVWRHMKRIGALYLQQCVCLVPDREDMQREVEGRAAAIREMGGDATIFDVPALREGEEERIIATFRDQRNEEYAEIVEECNTKFLKEIEFEHFRQNYTYGEAEEIRQDLEKIRRWYERVIDRDWFEASGREAVQTWVDRCESELATFEEAVYRRANGDLAEVPAAVDINKLLERGDVEKSKEKEE